MAVSCEWDVETVSVSDRNGRPSVSVEVLDHNHQESFEDCLKFAEEHPLDFSEGERFQIVVVRDRVSMAGNSERTWNHLRETSEGWKLSDWFSDAYGDVISTTPKRLHSEVSKTLKSCEVPEGVI